MKESNLSSLLSHASLPSWFGIGLCFSLSSIVRPTPESKARIPLVGKRRSHLESLRQGSDLFVIRPDLLRPKLWREFKTLPNSLKYLFKSPYQAGAVVLVKSRAKKSMVANHHPLVERKLFLPHLTLESSSTCTTSARYKLNALCFPFLTTSTNQAFHLTEEGVGCILPLQPGRHWDDVYTLLQYRSVWQRKAPNTKPSNQSL